MVILPMVAQVAADDPDTAAKMAQPTTLVCSKRPGSQLSHGASPRNRSCDSRDRNRISPIHRNKGSAVSVQLDEAPHMVMAMASPAGRLENSSMPSHAVPASVRPTHTPDARKPKIETINSVITSASFIACFFAVSGFWYTFDASYRFVHHRDKENNRTHRHGNLRYPQRRGVVAGGNVVVGVRVHCQFYAEPAQRSRDQAAHQQGEDVQPHAALVGQGRKHQADAYVLAALEGVRQRQEAGGRHGVTRIGVQTADMYAQLARDDRHRYRYQHTHSENRGQAAGYQIQLVEKSPHAYLAAR